MSVIQNAALNVHQLPHPNGNIKPSCLKQVNYNDIHISETGKQSNKASLRHGLEQMLSLSIVKVLPVFKFAGAVVREENCMSFSIYILYGTTYLDRRYR